MQSFQKSQIDAQRNKLALKYQQERAHLDNRTIDYFILPQDLFQGIPNGLHRMTGNPEDGYVIGVSEQVPEDLKPYFALAEHDEFIVYGLNDIAKTLNAERKIISLLDANSTLQKEYATNKLLLYQHITEHAKDDLEKWCFTLTDYNGFLRAIEFLQKV
jgi:hypothetical protein